jgi:tetratricopeptide (TPR) repeat protein
MMNLEMNSLRHHDTMRVEAAQGWLELGSCAEAAWELDQVSPEGQHHPQVLEVRWTIHERARDWNRCLEIAETLTDAAPRSAIAWLLLVASLHYLGKTEEACETLLEVMDEFPEEPAFPYRLACYYCHEGQWRQAKEWLERALQLGNRELKQAAKTDPALLPLWENVDRL